jgi:hypothetical protein
MPRSSPKLSFATRVPAHHIATARERASHLAPRQHALSSWLSLFEGGQAGKEMDQLLSTEVVRSDAPNLEIFMSGRSVLVEGSN